MIAKNNNILVQKISKDDPKFLGAGQKPHHEVKVINVGELCKGTYQPNQILLVSPHASIQIENDIYLVREDSVLVEKN